MINVACDQSRTIQVCLNLRAKPFIQTQTTVNINQTARTYCCCYLTSAKEMTPNLRDFTYSNQQCHFTNETCTTQRSLCRWNQSRHNTESHSEQQRPRTTEIAPDVDSFALNDANASGPPTSRHPVLTYRH